MAAKSKLGHKRRCQNCEILFYDMEKSEISCPECNQVFDPESAMRLKRQKMLPVNDAEKSDNSDDISLDADLDSGDNISTDIAAPVIEDTDDLNTDDDVPTVAPKTNDDDDDI